VIILGVLLLAIGAVFLVAGFTGRPKALIGLETETVNSPDNASQDAPDNLAETPSENPPESPSPTIPTSKRFSTVLLGIVGLFFGIISIIDNTAG
jgi:hypothetical protein